MGFFARLREKKEEYAQQQNINRASELKKLREQRIAEEGRAKLIKIENEQRQRIADAKKVQFENSNVGKLIGFVKAQKNKGVSSKKASTKSLGKVPQEINRGATGLQLGNRPLEVGGNRGIDLGGNSPFNVGGSNNSDRFSQGRGLNFGGSKKSPFNK